MPAQPRAGMLVAALLAAAPAFADPVPVSLAPARRQDVAVMATGIGTVQAHNTAAIRARVDGTIERIAFIEGQDVHRGDLLAVIDPRPYAAALAQAEAKRAGDLSQSANSRRDLARIGALARSAFASRQQLDTQVATVGQSSATVQADDAAIAQARLNLEFCNVTSPIDGVVGLRQIDVGNLVHATDTAPIVTVAQVQPISMVFTLPAEALPRVRAAMANGTPPVEATSTDGSRVLSHGQLLTMANSVDVSTGTIALKATFANADRALWPGQPVGAAIRLAVHHDAVTVPPVAVQHGPDGLYVFTVGPDHRARKQDVTVGYSDATVAEITQGLKDGETVVTAGQVRVEPGVEVRDAGQPAG